jgi:hypothetical protein
MRNLTHRERLLAALAEVWLKAEALRKPVEGYRQSPMLLDRSGWFKRMLFLRKERRKTRRRRA